MDHTHAPFWFACQAVSVHHLGSRLPLRGSLGDATGMPDVTFDEVLRRYFEDLRDKEGSLSKFASKTGLTRQHLGVWLRGYDPDGENRGFQTEYVDAVANSRPGSRLADVLEELAILAGRLEQEGRLARARADAPPVQANKGTLVASAVAGELAASAKSPAVVGRRSRRSLLRRGLPRPQRRADDSRLVAPCANVPVAVRSRADNARSFLPVERCHQHHDR